MGRPMHRLSARGVAAASTGYHSDGAGLYLLVKPTGSRSWVYRYRVAGRLREMGLGSALAVSLADARRKAADLRTQRADGIDPIDARLHARQNPARTWGEACADYISAQAPGWRNEAQAAQWRHSLKEYGPKAGTPLQKVDTTLVLSCLRAIWTTKTETAVRLRGRIERIWDAERVAGQVTGENPARWKGHLQHLLAAPTKVSKRSKHAALHYRDAPAFMRDLRSHRTAARLALEFTVLTAARTNETVGFHRGELDGTIWTIPGERMKAGRDHAVPLSRQALEVLKFAPGDRPFDLSENGMLFALQREPPRGMGHHGVTVHGFRSTFRDWAAERTHHPAEVVEMALAHAISNKTEAAYRRGDLLAKRALLMQDWADYLDGLRNDESPASREG